MIQAIHLFKELITTQLQRGLVTKLGYAKHAIINLKVSMPCYRLHTLYYNSVYYNLYNILYYNSVYILSTKGSSCGLELKRLLCETTEVIGDIRKSIQS